jgi:hypothetical protein
MSEATDIAIPPVAVAAARWWGDQLRQAVGLTGGLQPYPHRPHASIAEEHIQHLEVAITQNITRHDRDRSRCDLQVSRGIPNGPLSLAMAQVGFDFRDAQLLPYYAFMVIQLKERRVTVQLDVIGDCQSLAIPES